MEEQEQEKQGADEEAAENSSTEEEKEVKVNVPSQDTSQTNLPQQENLELQLVDEGKESAEEEKESDDDDDDKTTVPPITIPLEMIERPISKKSKSPKNLVKNYLSFIVAFLRSRNKSTRN